MDARTTDEGQRPHAYARGDVLSAEPALSPVGALANHLATTGIPAKAVRLAVHGVLCLLAALTVLVALGGLAGNHPQTSDAVLDVLRTMGATGLADAVRGPLEDLVRDKQLAMLLLVGGLALTALLSWSYLRAFRIAARPLAGDDGAAATGGGPLRALGRILAAETLVVIVLCAIATGSLADAIGDVTGVSNDAVMAWDIVKWPALLVMAFVVFAALQRSAFTDPRVLASSSVAFTQVFAVLVWLVAATGFVLYLVSFGRFEDTYGTIGSAIVLLVWLTMFSMLYYATPDLRVAAVGSLGAGAALSAVTWLLSCAALAVCVSALDALTDPLAAAAAVLVFLVGTWATNVVVLLGVRLNARWTEPLPEPPAAAAPVSPPASPVPPRAPREPVATTPSGAVADELFQAVSLALQNDAAHDTMLRPVAANEARDTQGLSDLELDLSDWGFTYGVAWATARAQDSRETDDVVADRALAAASRVFHLYCGDPDWAERIRLQTGRRSRREADVEAESAEPQAPVPAGRMPEPYDGGDAERGNGHGRFPPRPQRPAD